MLPVNPTFKLSMYWAPEMMYKKTINFIEEGSSNFIEKGSFISEENLKEILLGMNYSLYYSSSKNYDPNSEDHWTQHMKNLGNLEVGFRKNPNYKFESAVKLFAEHFEHLKKEGFETSQRIKFDEHRVIPHYIPSFAYCTPLGWSALHKMPALVGAILELKPDVNFGGTEYHDSTDVVSPVSFAVFPLAKDEFKLKKDPGLNDLTKKCIELLAEKGCDLDLGSKTPLWYASLYENNEAIKSLVKAKANIDAFIERTGCIAGHQSTALLVAINLDRFSTVKLLVDLKADLSSCPLTFKAHVELLKIRDSRVPETILDTYEKVFVPKFKPELYDEIPNFVRDMYTPLNIARGRKKDKIAKYINYVMVGRFTNDFLKTLRIPNVLVDMILDYYKDGGESEDETTKTEKSTSVSILS